MSFFDLGSARMFPTSKFKTYVSNHKDICIAAADHYVLLLNYVISIERYYSVTKFYNVITLVY